MSLLEADAANPEDAQHVLAAMVNRATASKQDLGDHVSSRLYQPTFEPSQHFRLGSILKMKAFGKLTEWAQRYSHGLETDPTGGATHFLAHPKVMLSLEARDPHKYRSWRKWTGYDAKTGDYANVVFRDRSHSFLAPDGRFTIGPMP
jgi:hypothetical protein